MKVPTLGPCGIEKRMTRKDMYEKGVHEEKGI